MLKILALTANLSHIPRVQKLGLRPMALAFLYPRPGQKPAQAKSQAWLGPAFFGLAWPGFWLQAGASTSLHFILSQPEVLHRFRCNPFMTFDDDFKCDIVYAWSLPAHPTFKRKMKLIAVAIDEAVLSPLYDYPSCHVFYFKCKICDVVQVSDIIMFA